MKYLDLTGLGEVWANIKSYISSKVPTKTSQLQNDSNYATTSQLPSKTSQLTNDSDFTTNAKLATKQDTISDLASIRSGASKGATAVQPSALNNYVDLSSGQTIDGSKVFINDVRIIKNSPFCYLFSNDYIKGETPTSNVYQGIRFFDAPTSGSANHITGGFEITHDTSGYTIASINARTYVNNRQVWKSINFRIANDDTRSIDFYPNSDSEINLGTATNKWKDVNTVLLNNKTPAYDADVVHKSGDETINGVKNFNNVVLGEQDGVIRIGNNVQGAHFSTLNYDGVFYNNTVKQFVPKTNNEYNLGTSSNKWKDVYTTTLHGDVDFPITEAQIAAIVV